MRYYSNKAAAATLTSDATSGATTLALDTVSGFPSSFPFTLVIDPDTTSVEVVTVTALAGAAATVTRGQDGTTAVAHSAGAVVIHAHSARDFKESRDHEAASSGVHGRTGSLVGDTDAQVLTNKNLSSGTNTFPSSLATLTGAQALTNKDLTSGTNTFPTSLANLTGAQALTNKDLSSGTNTFPASLATDAEVTAAIATAVFGGSGRTARPYARIKKTTGQNVADGFGSGEAITFQATDEETDATFGDHTNNRLVVPIDGLYRIELGWTADGSATGSRRPEIVLPGQPNVVSIVAGAAIGNSGVLSCTVRLTATQAISAMFSQNSGGALRIHHSESDTEHGTYLSAMWLAP